MANRTKSDFLANVSHELRTPLNAILGFSDLMRQCAFGDPGPIYRDYAGNIHDSGRHLLDLINDILDVSVIEAGRLTLQEETVPVADVTEAAVRLVRVRAAEGRVRIADGTRDSRLSLRADRRRLKQVLVNLLSNAVKFTPEGGEVAVAVAVAGDGAPTLTVQDTGIGMTAADVARALERFGQVDSGMARTHEGTGLGLPLTKALVEAHGGTLAIDSTPGVGTTVTVRFPAERVAPTA